MIRQDIKRAFFWWPAAASAAVIVATGLSSLAKPTGRDSQFAKSKQPSAIAALTLEPATGPATRITATEHPVGVADSVSRPDRGTRGLMLPGRLTEHWTAQLPQPGDAPSTQWLLAPVIDPVAELAGHTERFTTNPVRPSLFAPGVDPSQDAGGRDAIGSGTRRLGIFQFAQPTLQSAGDMTRRTWLAVGEASTTLRRWLPVAAPASRGEEAESLIPSSVRVMARPTVGHPVNAWPMPKQLRLDLAALSARGDAASDAGLTSGGTLVSSQTGAIELGDEDSAAAVRRWSHESLRREASAVVMGRWAEQVDRRLQELQQLPRLSDPRAGELIRQLHVLAETGLQLAERVPARDQQVRWLQAAHSVSRRVSVWGAIWELTRPADASDETLTSVRNDHASDQTPSDPTSSATTNVSLRPLIEAIRRDLDATGDRAGWESFLLLGSLEQLSSGDSYDDRALLAQRFLSRLNYHGLDARHLRWLDRPSIHALSLSVRRWTVTPVDYPKLLEDLERQESDSIDLASLEVTDAFQSLRYSDEMSSVRVAKALDVNYRNANIRTAISAQLINRLLPALPTQTAPVQTTVLGSVVRGQSHTDATLMLRLVPTEGAWQIELMTDGQVVAMTRGMQSGVVLHTRGQSDFHTSTPISIGPRGFEVGQTRVDVSGGNQLRGIDTRYDGWPLLGSLVESIAQARFQESKGIVQRISDTRVASEVQTKLDLQLRERSEIASQRLDEIVIGPLAHLNLNPKIIDMETTPSRLIARYRVAGDWQLAAHTPRPRATSDSWLSVQVHQSALNNTLEKILPRGDAKSIAELYSDTCVLFNQTIKSLPEDVPGDVEIQFADTRPITLEIEDGLVWLTFRIVSLSQPGSSKLTRFIVRAAYRPEVDGLDAKLVRDGHLRISGPGMSMRQRLPVRAIFNKVLDENRALPLTLPQLKTNPATADLIVTQLELRDGWIAMAIGPESDLRVAVLP